MTDDTPIQSALKAEQDARKAVEEARQQASAIRQQARERARHIEHRAEERIRRLRIAVDEELDARKKTIEREGARALRRLRQEAIGSAIIDDTVDEVVRRIMAESSGKTL